MMSQILKFVDFTKAQKSRYFEIETFFLKLKKNEFHIKSYFFVKNSFVAELTYLDKVKEYMLEIDKRFVPQKI